VSPGYLSLRLTVVPVNCRPVNCRRLTVARLSVARWSVTESSATDIWCMLVGSLSPMQMCFSDLVCQPLVTSYIIDAYLCLAMFHAWPLVPVHDALRLMVDTYESRKAMASWKDRRVALATSGSTRSRRRPTLYCSYLRCGDLRSPRATERRNGSLGLRDDDDQSISQSIIYSFIKMQHKMTMYNWRTGHARLGKSS